eukprot:m.148576 g.148576  ORF g.148576 m.148576 type:complete len:483 (-) comp9719_c0_seq5:236-1684(-)
MCTPDPSPAEPHCPPAWTTAPPHASAASDACSEARSLPACTQASLDCTAPQPVSAPSPHGTTLILGPHSAGASTLVNALRGGDHAQLRYPAPVRGPWGLRNATLVPSMYRIAGGHIIDIAGYGNPEFSREHHLAQVRAIRDTYSLSTILLVVNCNRVFDAADLAAFQAYSTILGEDMWKRVVLVFLIDDIGPEPILQQNPALGRLLGHVQPARVVLLPLWARSPAGKERRHARLLEIHHILHRDAGLEPTPWYPVCDDAPRSVLLATPSVLPITRPPSYTHPALLTLRIPHDRPAFNFAPRSLLEPSTQLQALTTQRIDPRLPLGGPAVRSSNFPQSAGHHSYQLALRPACCNMLAGNAIRMFGTPAYYAPSPLCPSVSPPIANDVAVFYGLDGLDDEHLDAIETVGQIQLLTGLPAQPIHVGALQKSVDGLQHRFAVFLSRGNAQQTALCLATGLYYRPVNFIVAPHESAGWLFAAAYKGV